MADDEGTHYRSGFWDLCQPRGAPVTTCEPRGSGCLLGCTALWCPCCVYSEITGRLTSRQFEFGSNGHEYTGCEQFMSCCCYTVLSPFGNFMLFNPLGALVGWNVRRSVNKLYNSSETSCEAYGASLFCPACSLAQVYREISYAKPDDPVTKAPTVGAAPPHMHMNRMAGRRNVM